MPPCNWVILPLTQPEVANQQKKKKKKGRAVKFKEDMM